MKYHAGSTVALLRCTNSPLCRNVSVFILLVWHCSFRYGSMSPLRSAAGKSRPCMISRVSHPVNVFSCAVYTGVDYASGLLESFREQSSVKNTSQRYRPYALAYVFGIGNRTFERSKALPGVMSCFFAKRQLSATGQGTGDETRHTPTIYFWSLELAPVNTTAYARQRSGRYDAVRTCDKKYSTHTRIRRLLRENVIMGVP